MRRRAVSACWSGLTRHFVCRGLDVTFVASVLVLVVLVVLVVLTPQKSYNRYLHWAGYGNVKRIYLIIDRSKLRLNESSML